jgi:hypothetical protein
MGGLMLALVSPLAAQKHDGRWNEDQWEHTAVGAAVALVMRGPWVAPSWRDRVWKRGATMAALVTVFELYQHYIFGGFKAFPFIDTVLDAVATMTGWVLVEVVDAIR